MNTQPPPLPEYRPKKPSSEPLGQRVWLVVAALVLFFPAGLVLAWRRPGWTSKTKWVITASIALVLVVGAAAGETTSPQASPSKPKPRAPLETPSEEPTPTPAPTFQPYTPPPVDPIPVEFVSITRVIDGDTVEVAHSDGSRTKVRFIGVDTPESTTRVEAFGREASAYTKNLLPAGKGVYLERDFDDTDQYGRDLAYMWLSKPSDDTDEDFIRTRMVNALLLLKGWAQVYTFPPNVKYVDYFTEFQTEAREGEFGLWKPAPPAPRPAPAPKQPSKPNPPSGNCDSSYPDFCIPPPPPDLDCDEVNGSDFTVVGDDPHGFDRDRDGIGCES